MKRLIVLMMTCLSINVLAEVKVKIHEPIRFKNINTKAYGDIVVGQGAIEIYSTAIEEDLGKKIKIRFPEQGLMTNQKRWLKVEKYKIAKADEEFIIEKDKRIVKFYAFIRRRELNKTDFDGARVEGEYLGYTPVVIEQYGKPINPTPTTSLPSSPRPVVEEKDESVPELGDIPVPFPLRGGE